MKKHFIKILLFWVILITTRISCYAQLPENGYDKIETDPDSDYKYYRCYWDGHNWLRACYYEVPDLVEVSIDVTYDYDEAYKLIDLVNEERKRAGVCELKTNDYLMQVAMERAAEACLDFGHERPSGGPLITKSMFIDGENLHLGGGAESAIEGWKESSGHYATMIRPDFKYCGYGVVYGRVVAIFTKDRKSYEVDCNHVEAKRIYLENMPFTRVENWSETYTTMLNSDYESLTCHITDIKRNEEIFMCRKEGFPNKGYAEDNEALKDNREYILSIGSEDNYNGKDKKGFGGYGGPAIKVENLTPDICILSGNKLIPIKPGIIKIKASLGQRNTRIFEIPVVSGKIKSGDIITDSKGVSYKVISPKKKTVAYEAPAERSGEWSISIPDRVKIEDITYKVTGISDNAFSGNTRLSEVIVGKNVTTIGKNAFSGCGRLWKVTMGKNVTTIGSNAFSGCKKLRRLHIKSSKLKSVGKNALKGAYKNLIIKVPKKKINKYKKLFKKKTGYNKKMKIQKYTKYDDLY